MPEPQRRLSKFVVLFTKVYVRQLGVVWVSARYLSRLACITGDGREPDRTEAVRVERKDMVGI